MGFACTGFVMGDLRCWRIAWVGIRLRADVAVWSGQALPFRVCQRRHGGVNLLCIISLNPKSF
jgi:hypothetical protein